MAHPLEQYNLYDEDFNPFDAGGFGSSDGLGRDYDPPPNVDAFGNVIAPPGTYTPPVDPYAFNRDFTSSRYQGGPTSGLGRSGAELGAQGFGQNLLDSLLDYSGIADLKASTLSDLQAKFREGMAGFDRAEQNARSSGGGAIARINAAISEKKGELANANKQYRNYMDTIAPGFAEAVDKAEKAAMATAAIEATFDKAQGAVDASYASASGRVRAIADKVAGSGAVEVANALNESVYEFKSFIDEQGKLNREQTLLMHQAAAGLAAAAAESEHAGLEGTTAREQYVTQVKYEKIISDLLRQRAAAGAARRRALNQLKQAREDWARGFNEEAQNRWREIEGFQLEFMSAQADKDQWYASSASLLFNNFEKEGIGIDRDDQNDIFGLALHAHKMGISIPEMIGGLGGYVEGLSPPPAWNRDPDDPTQPLIPASMATKLMKWEDQAEVMLHSFADAERFHDEEIGPLATNPENRFIHDVGLFQALGVREGSAVEAAFERQGPQFLPTYTAQDFGFTFEQDVARDNLLTLLGSPR